MGTAPLTCQEMTMFFCLEAAIWIPKKKHRFWRAIVNACANPIKGVVRAIRFWKDRKKKKMSPYHVASYNKLHFMSDMHYKAEERDTLAYTGSKKCLKVLSQIPGGKLLQIVGMSGVWVYRGTIRKVYRGVKKFCKHKFTKTNETQVHLLENNKCKT